MCNVYELLKTQITGLFSSIIILLKIIFANTEEDFPALPRFFQYCSVVFHYFTFMSKSDGNLIMLHVCYFLLRIILPSNQHVCNTIRKYKKRNRIVCNSGDDRWCTSSSATIGNIIFICYISKQRQTETNV